MVGSITPNFSFEVVNQRSPPGPTVIALGYKPFMGNSVTAWVLGFISPIRLALSSVNQRLPFATAVIPVGAVSAVGIGYSVTASVVGSMTPIWSAPCSVNQKSPSGSAVMPVGTGLFGVTKSEIAWVVGLIVPM